MTLLKYINTGKQQSYKWFLYHLHRCEIFWNMWFLLVIEFFAKHMLALDMFTLN